MERSKNHLDTNSLYINEELLSEYSTVNGQKILIPRCMLYGSQNQNEYDLTKRKRVELGMSQEGISYLLKNPINVCALSEPEDPTAWLVIYNGHH